MSAWAYLRSAGARFWRRGQMDAELEEELRSHIAHRADDLRRGGLDPAEAERQARLEFGGRARIREECYEAAGGNLLDTLGQDIRFSLRLIRHSPGFPIVAVLTLALAIGANTLVFGILHGMFMSPLHVAREDSLYSIARGTNAYLSYPDYLDIRDRNNSLDGLAGYDISQAGMTFGDRAYRVWINTVTGNYFDVLGVQPHLGRFLHASDEQGPNSAPYVVLSHKFWQSRFHGDRGVIGQVVQLNRHPFTIIGVAPPEFHGTLLMFSPDLYVPLLQQEQIEGNNDLARRGRSSVFMAMGHLKDGVTPEQAVADLNRVGQYLERTYPVFHGPTTFVLSRPAFGGDFVARPLRAFVSGVMLLGGLILLAACANLGSLFAARAADRAREVALRLALGGGHNRIVRQILTEAMLIASAGGAAGWWASVVLLRWLQVWDPMPRYPIRLPVNADWPVALAAAALAVASGILFGLVPVGQVLRADAYQVIKAGSRGLLPKLAFRDVLLFAQIAICAVLVTSSLVAVRGLWRSMESHFGFIPDRALLADTDPTMAGYSGEQVAVLQQRMLDAVTGVAGIESAGLISRPPLAEGWFTTDVFFDGTTDFRAANAASKIVRFSASPGYFEAAGTALLAGRGFSRHDSRESTPVAVVNRELARRLFGSDPAVGRYFHLRDGKRVQVAGVVEDGRYVNLTEEPQAAAFFPLAQSPWNETWIVARSRYEEDQAADAVRAALRSVDAALPVYVQSWKWQLRTALLPSRTATLALGVLGAMGAVLAITGIFGMAAYSVSKRLKELGVRIAIGAQPRQVLRAALGRPLLLLIYGSAAGVLLGVLGSRVLASIVYQATPREPVVLGGVALVMLAAGVLASWIPAQRALSVDPLALLREE